MTTTPPKGQEPEALRLADALASNYFDGKQGRDVWDAAAAELRPLHTQVAALTASQPAQQGGERAVPETLGVYCGIASDDVTDPTHPRYVAGFKAGHAAGKKRASHGQAPAGAAENAETILREALSERRARTDGGLVVLADRVRHVLRNLADSLTALEATAQPAPAATPQADSQPAPDDFQPCPSCFGTGVEGDADDYGRTIDVTCGDCNGSGRSARAPAGSGTAPAGVTVAVGSQEFDLADTGARFTTADMATACGQAFREGLAAAPTPPAQAADSVLKDHQIAALVNELRDIAIKYHGTQQLRERIAHAVVPALKARAADSVLEDAARWQELRAQHEDDAAERCCVFAPNDMRECLVPVGGLPGELDAFIDAQIAARKQGASRD